MEVTSIRISALQALTVKHFARESEDILIWTVFENAPHYPGEFIARPFSVLRNVTYRCHLSAPKLEALREMLPAGMERLDRVSTDAPAVVEIWV